MPLLSRVSLPLAPSFATSSRHHWSPTARSADPHPLRDLATGPLCLCLLETPLPQRSSRLLPHTLPFVVKAPPHPTPPLAFLETRLHYVAQAVLELVM